MADERLHQWQREVWNTMARTYLAEAEQRMNSIAEGCLARLHLKPGDDLLDLGSGTGALALMAAKIVGEQGRVTAVDISDEMLSVVSRRAGAAGVQNIIPVHGRAEGIPERENSQDALVASLSLMFVLDKSVAAREIARVLRRGGRFVASVWAPPDRCDIVRFQRTVGSFAPEPPVKGVGPGSMAKPENFVGELEAAGIHAHVEESVATWSHPSLEHAWETFAAVTAGRMTPEQIELAKAAVARDMWPEPGSPREFRNALFYIVGIRT